MTADVPLSERDIDFIDLCVMKGAQFQRLVPLAIRAGLVSLHAADTDDGRPATSEAQTYSDPEHRISPLSRQGDPLPSPPQSETSLRPEGCAFPEASGPSYCPPEIEITPAMVEAGYRVLVAAGITDDLLEADRQTVVEIYQAMAVLRSGQSRLAGWSPLRTC